MTTIYILGNERLIEKHKQDSKMAFVMKSIMTFAYGLHNMQRDLCPNINGLCPAMLPVNGSLFLQYLNNVTFVSGSFCLSCTQMITLFNFLVCSSTDVGK